MLTLSWTTPVTVPGDPATARDRLWRALLDKAENPVPYVPAITACTVVERYADGFLREAVRGERRLVQRVFADEAAGRVVFRHVDGTDFAEIRDQLGEAGDGRPTLTLAVRLTAEATERAEHDSEYVRALNQDFEATLAEMTQALLAAAARFGELAGVR
ncbi:AtaL-like protein [Kitasatospora sp. NPDC056138]|uniref:AtaL-like protein n=1 Tax=Kitasatospora sp. NPDC056138 TaxID=3345724 RepID=UPI0035DBCFA9